MMSGVRGSPVGGKPGRLKIISTAGPKKISPIPAAEAFASNVETAYPVWLESAS
jgi:hypothetical protein